MPSTARAGGTYAGVVMAGPPSATDSFRDVSDRHGFTYRQFTNGGLYVLKAPRQDNFGAWATGTSGGPMEGKTLQPGTALWAKVTKQIGEHPSQALLRREVQGAYSVGDKAIGRVMSGPGNWSGGQTGAGPGSWGQAPSGPSDRPSPQWLQTIQDVASGFTADPSGPGGELTQTLVQAAPNIQGTIYQLTTPQTFEGMSRRLGRLKGDLSRTRDPRKVAILNEQIAAIEYKLGLMRQQMGMAVTPPPTVSSAPTWLPWAIGGGVIATVVAVFAGGRRRRR